MYDIDELLERVAENLNANRDITNTPARGKPNTADNLSEAVLKRESSEHTAEDLRISKPLIRMQADIAEARKSWHLSYILRIAAEAAAVPERVLAEIDTLSGVQLAQFADKLEQEYRTILLSQYLREQVR